jgi:hypothetical protein
MTGLTRKVKPDLRYQYEMCNAINKTLSKVIWLRLISKAIAREAEKQSARNNNNSAAEVFWLAASCGCKTGPSLPFSQKEGPGERKAQVL